MGGVIGEFLHAFSKIALDQRNKFVPFAFVQLADNGNVLHLLFRKFAMRPVDLGENIAGINK